jgi:hypothetical protein
MWAAKHCSILFSSILHQPERFYACTENNSESHALSSVPLILHVLTWYKASACCCGGICTGVGWGCWNSVWYCWGGCVWVTWLGACAGVVCATLFTWAERGAIGGFPGEWGFPLGSWYSWDWVRGRPGTGSTWVLGLVWLATCCKKRNSLHFFSVTKIVSRYLKRGGPL